ncbi:MAG: GIY-YIG nuclease family protein [Sulfitobacter sp.]
MSKFGRSLELFFVDGRPDGMLTANVFNWTGHVLRIPRLQIAEGLKRPEAKRTGVYLLVGERENGALAYIGEAENIADRLGQHVVKKDWWDTAILISTTGDLLHKAHIKYLESRLVEIAQSVGQIPLENGNTPARSSLDEAAQGNMESFLETLMMVLPAIRFDMFDSKVRRQDSGVPKPNSPEIAVDETQFFELTAPKYNVEGFAKLQDGEMVVQAGSRGRFEWSPGSSKHHYAALFQILLDSGTIKRDGNNTIFTTDYAFNSPTAAAAILKGRPTSGRTSWRETNSGLTYAEWETRNLELETTQ